MKQLKIIVEDREYKKLIKLKKKLSWHDFILLMAEHCEEVKKRGDFEVYGEE